MKSPAYEDWKLVRSRDLSCPFHGRFGNSDEIAEQKGIGNRVPGILLTGGDHEGGL